MIVCVCNNVSEGKIRRAVEEGIDTMPALREQLGVGNCCGKCHTCAKTILRDCLEEGMREAQPVPGDTAIAA
jgi:bacterioferritin-associated ferredoxin